MTDVFIWIYRVLEGIYKKAPWLLGPAAGIASMLGIGQGLWSQLFARIDSLVVPAMGGAVNFAPLSLVNYLFPLDTICELLVIYGGLRIVCAGIRVIKSFIPTIA
ncbi:MAG: hypothetical protein IPL86_16760 [Flavobacteriales bacterium]|nr:hypothetical protein [Flavobacteriales bacterium]MBK8583403.1 hypothetical protein [Flavobacteriales bacterium]